MFTLFLRSPCLSVNNSMFLTRILLNYLPSLLAIIASIRLKISEVCHLSADFMGNLIYLPSLNLMMTLSKCTAHNAFFLFYLTGYTSQKMLIQVKTIDV